MASSTYRHTAIKHSSPYHTKRFTSRPSVTFANSHTAWLEDSIYIDDSHHQSDSRNAKPELESYQGSDSDDAVDETKAEYGSDGDDFVWEEEATLVSELMGEPPRQTEDERIVALVESLQPEFTAEGAHFKEEMARVLVPTVNNLKTAFRALDEQVDESYARGTLQFDEATIIIERALHQEMTDIKDKYQSTLDAMSKLHGQLEDEYALRDKLWGDVRKTLAELVEPTQESLKDLPAKVERAISQLNRQSKAIEKGDDPSSDLKHYLAKLAL